jgi:hypothetical protein
VLFVLAGVAVIVVVAAVSYALFWAGSVEL